MDTAVRKPFFTRSIFTSLFRWKNLAAAAAAVAIAVSLYRYMYTLHSGAMLAYLLYPLSVPCLALLLYTRAYLRYPEVRLMGAFFGWTLVVIVLNMNRANGALSSEWFYTLCAACFLCFSLPYAFEASEQKRVLSFLAVVTVLLSAAFCAFAVYNVMAGRVIDAHTGVEGALGIGSDGRLWMFCYPNAAAPICGIGLLLSAYLFFSPAANPRRKWPQFLLILPFLICTIALALTDSRAGILSSAAALGTIAFFAVCASQLFQRKRLYRVIFAAVLALVVMFAFYKGSAWIRQGYNAYFSVTHLESSVPATMPSNETATDAADTTASLPEASAPAGDTAVPPQAQTISSRDLSDLGDFNGRTAIWAATLRGLTENPSVLLTGTTPIVAGKMMTVYFPPEAPAENFHNSFVAILVSFGIPGLLLILALLVLLAIRGVQAIVHGLFDAGSLHVRLVLSLLIFTLAESMMEQFLFVDGMPSVVWIWFMLAAGFTFCFSRETAAPASAAEAQADR